MTRIEPPPEHKEPEPKFPPWVIAIVFIACVAVLSLLPDDAEPRNRMRFDAAWVLFVVPPPEKTDCRITAFEIFGPSGEIVHAAIGAADPFARTAEAVPLSTSSAPRLYCDGFE